MLTLRRWYRRLAAVEKSFVSVDGGPWTAVPGGSGETGCNTIAPERDG